MCMSYFRHLLYTTFCSVIVATWEPFSTDLSLSLLLGFSLPFDLIPDKCQCQESSTNVAQYCMGKYFS